LKQRSSFFVSEIWPTDNILSFTIFHLLSLSSLNSLHLIMRFLLHQNIIPKCSWSMFYWDWILIRVVQIVIYYVPSFVKWSSCSYKMRYKGYLELIYRCLLNVMYTKLTLFLNVPGQSFTFSIISKLSPSNYWNKDRAFLFLKYGQLTTFSLSPFSIYFLYHL